MNWQAKIPEKDAELLCEYLDDALSIKDRAKFEKRLQQSPELEKALEDMTALKNSMRSLPCKSVPHHFTLTRSEAVNARRGRFLVPTFGWASVVSMILLGTIFGTEFLFTSYSAPQTAPEPIAMTLQEDAAVPESAMKASGEEAIQPVYLLNWVEVGGKGGAGGAEYGSYLAITEGVTAEGIGAGELVQSGESGEPTVTEANPAEAKISVEPLIFGVREDQLGQVLATEPDENSVPMVAAAQEVVDAEKEPLISNSLKLLLAGLAVVFGLVWLLLKTKR